MNFSIKYNKILNKSQRDEIRHAIIKVIGVSYPTFNRWANGVTIPNKRYHAAIAEIMGVSESELFPTTDNKSDLTI